MAARIAQRKCPRKSQVTLVAGVLLPLILLLAGGNEGGIEEEEEEEEGGTYIQ